MENTRAPRPLLHAAVAALSVLLLAVPLRVLALSVEIPIEVDYPVLQQVLVQQLFDSPDQTRDLLNDPGGCSRVLLSQPRVAGKPPNLELEIRLDARIGVQAFGSCSELLRWRGGVGVIVHPVIRPGATSLRLEPVKGWLLDSSGNTVTSGRVWELVKDHLYPLVDRFEFNLAPPLNVVGEMLGAVLPRHSARQLQSVISSMQLRDIRVGASGVGVTLGFEVEELTTQGPAQSQAPLSPDELRRWEQRWQMMDALFTFAIKHYAAATDQPELRRLLLDILIDSRYRLSEALTMPANRANDPVRRWFLKSWERLRPAIRRIALSQPDRQPLLWISLVAATDALNALDRIGPSIGLDISTDGLKRLARLINRSTDMDPLRYDQAVDPQLQRLFETPEPAPPSQPSGFRFDLWPIPSAWAGTTSKRLERWAPNRDQLGEYLPLVAALLEETADRQLKQHSLKPPVAGVYRKLLLATAWQESCWRQYVVKNKKLEPLRSGTGDVGLMQINEKVWRGFYDIQKLRWDVGYNGRAGAEILYNYLTRYALKQGEHKRSGGLDNLARASYSAYNGGPSKVSRYRNPNTASTHKKVDRAFWKKYQRVKAGKALEVAQCLGGEVPVATAKRRTQPDTARRQTALKQEQSRSGRGETPAPAASPPVDARRWALKQADGNYTLQLAAFSTQKNAQTFIARHALSDRVGIHPLRKGDAQLFAVVYGSYPNRADAEQAQRSLKGHKPWLRSFGDIRKAGRP